MRHTFDKGKRCIVVIASYAPSLVNFRGHLLQAFRDKGLIVHAAAPLLNANNSTGKQLLSRGVIIHDIPLQRAKLTPFGDLLTFFRLLLLLRTIRPEFVLCYTIKPVVYGMLAARIAGVPNRFALITGLGYAFTKSKKGERAFVSKIVYRLYALSIKHANKAFFQNSDDQKLFRETGIMPEVIPSAVINGSGVDLDYFNLAPLPEKLPGFLLIARLLGDKGIREYAKAAEIIRSRFPNTTFRLVGDIDDNPDSIARNEIQQWVDSGVLEYFGYLDDVRPAIAGSSVYVLPSYGEGTPRTVLEAMAMGRAVITTDVPGCRETVIDGENGFLVAVKDVGALVHAMEKLIKQPELILSMGMRSRALAEKKYDVHKVNAVILKEMGITC